MPVRGHSTQNRTFSAKTSAVPPLSAVATREASLPAAAAAFSTGSGFDSQALKLGHHRFGRLREFSEPPLPGHASEETPRSGDYFHLASSHASRAKTQHRCFSRNRHGGAPADDSAIRANFDGCCPRNGRDRTPHQVGNGVDAHGQLDCLRAGHEANCRPFLNSATTDCAQELRAFQFDPLA